MTVEANKGHRVQNIDNDGDILGGSIDKPQIVQVVDETEKVSPAGESVSNAPYVNSTIQNPEFAHLLDELHMNAVTESGKGTAIDILSYDKVTVCIYATSTTSGGVFTFQASYQSATTDALWGTIASTGSNSIASNTQTVDSDGVFIFEINIKKLKHFRVSLTRTDGTFSVYVWG